MAWHDKSERLSKSINHAHCVIEREREREREREMVTECENKSY